MTFYRTTRMMLCSAAILSFASSAFALDGNDLLKKINDVYGQQGGSIAATSIDVDDSTVTLKGATFKAPGMDDSIPLGDITLDGVEENNGGYTIEEIDFADVDFSKDGASVSATDLKLNGVEIPADTTKGDLSSLLYYKSAHAGAVSVTKDDTEVFSIEGADATMNKRDDKSGLDFDAKINGIKADLSKVDDQKTKDAIEALKLQQLYGTVSMKGSWEIAPGTINISEYSFDFKDIGKLNLAFSISGYTPAFAKSMQEELKTVRSNPNQQEAQQSAGLAMLGLLQPSVMCVNTPAQYGALAALSGPQEYLDDWRETYRRNRDLVLSRIAGSRYSAMSPDGGFYVWLDISAFGERSEAFALRVLDQCNVAVTPGTAFGTNGEGYVRLSLATTREKLDIGLDRLLRA